MADFENGRSGGAQAEVQDAFGQGQSQACGWPQNQAAPAPSAQPAVGQTAGFAACVAPAEATASVPSLDMPPQGEPASAVSQGASAPAMPYADPRESVPEPLRPGAHRVHHTYIWIGGIQAAISVVFAIAVVLVGNIVGSIAEEGMPDVSMLVPYLPFIAAGVVVLTLLLVGLVFFFQWLSWKHLTYELGTGEFSLFSGILNKKRMHVPYQRVQAVNQTAGVLQRLIGVCNVKVDTAGGAANDGVLLKYLRVSDAEALRAELFRRKKVLLADGSIAPDGTACVGGVSYPSAWALACAGIVPQAAQAAFGYAPYPAAASSPEGGNVLDAADEMLHDVRGVFGGDEVETGAVSFEAGLSNKELLLAGISGAGERLALIFVGAMAAIGTFSQMFEGALENWVEDAVVSTLGQVDSAALANGAQIADAAGALASSAALQLMLWAALAVAALWVVAALGTVVRYGGFRLRRRESRIEVESGLLSRSFHGVDVDRVQSVVVKQGFIRRLMGYCELSVAKIDSLAPNSYDTSQASRPAPGVVIHPFVKLSRVPEIIAGALPEFSDMPGDIVKPAPVARRRAIVRMGIITNGMFWLAVFVAISHILLAVVSSSVPTSPEDQTLLDIAFMAFCVVYALFALSLVVKAVDAILWHRQSALGYDRAFLRITNGGLSAETTYTPRRKIQFAFTRTNPFQRAAHVATVNVSTAAGVSGTMYRLWDVSEDDAEALVEWTRPRRAANAADAAVVLEDAGAARAANAADAAEDADAADVAARASLAEDARA